MREFKPKYTITNRMTSAITQIELARGFLEAARLSDDWCPEVNRRSLQRDLKIMIEKELIGSEGATNQLVYFLRV